MKRLKLIGTGNGGMSGGKHFWGIWGTENRLSFSFLSFLFFFFCYTEWNVGSVKAFVLSTDMEENKMCVRLIEGMRSDEN